MPCLKRSIMIQRIQTIYLLLAGIAAGFPLALPIGYQQQASGTLVEVMISQFLPAMIVTALAAFIALISIFLFKKRGLQMKTTIAALLLSLSALTMLLVNIFILQKDLVQTPNYIPLAMSFFSVVFCALAYKGIKSDEQLVRSMDRLR